jgi:quinol monooxygenase YgiN
MSIIRIVKMTFAPEHLDKIMSIFAERQSTIKKYNGCRHLELWQDEKNPFICFTYSIWDDEHHLNAYRFSPFFKETWTLTKALFTEKADAWTTKKIEV